MAMDKDDDNVSSMRGGYRLARGLLLAVCFSLSVWVGQRLWVDPIHPLPDAILPCVSYAPFRDLSHSPFDTNLRFSSQRLQDDLERIRSVSLCLRTYGLDHGMDAIPELARRLGLRVRMGIWLGPDQTANRREVETAVALAGEYSDVIDMVIVGNEVLLRGDLRPEELATLLAEVRSRVSVPVTYADVWAFWQRHAEMLLPHADLVTVHILPYWEDEPIGAGSAVDYVHSRYKEMQALFAPMPVWVGETGWPARGRARGPALPGTREQAGFVHGLLLRETTDPIDFNLIEAFDQPWKRLQEGAMGGAWGVFASDGSRRIDWTKSSRGWPSWVGLAGLAGFLGLGLVVLLRGRSGGRLLTNMMVLLIAALIVIQLEMAWIWSRSPAEWLFAIAGLVVSTGLSLGLVGRIRGDRNPASTEHQWLLRFGVFVWLALLLVETYGLIFDGRYRAFNWPLVLGPLVFAAVWRLLDADRACQLWGTALLRIMAFTAGLAGVVVLAQEGLVNLQALVLSLMLLGLAGVYGLAVRSVDQA